MNLSDLINRTKPPIPWAEGDNIPWNEPEFSRRMLKEHLSQAHDAASRRFEIIDQQVDFIHTKLLQRQPTHVLDLGCGPGFYTERLARLGHTSVGIDYSPASIEYAVSIAQRERLVCRYVLQDIRLADYPPGMGLVMSIYGEFNAFRTPDAGIILDKTWQALEPGGWLVLEPHRYEMVKELGQESPSWYSSQNGLFSERGHIVLQENSWDDDIQAATTRFYVIDGRTGKVTRYAHSLQAYQDEDYRSLIEEHGFEGVKIEAGLAGENSTRGLMAVTARKPKQ